MLNSFVFNSDFVDKEESMGFVLSENFDNVTAPALPSDVTVVLTDSETVATSTSFSLSGSNSVVATYTGVIATPIVYSGKSDSTNGNCSVSAAVYAPTSAANFYCGVKLGVGGKWVHGAANDNSYYVITTPPAGNGLSLIKNVGGVQTTIAFTGVGVSPFTFGIWYVITLYRSGTHFIADCQRQTDLNWLTSSGTWQTNYVAAINATDSSLTSTASYGGILLYLGAAGSMYGDNLVIRDQTTILPAGPLKGENLGLNLTYSGPSLLWPNWTTAWSASDGTKAQIDLAKSIGCNCVRILGFYCGKWQGLFTQANYISYLQQVISYCKSIGMYYYLTEYLGNSAGTGNIVPFDAGSNTVNIFNQIASEYAAVVSAVASYKNLLAFDMYQEYNGFGTTNPYMMFNGTTVQSGSNITNSAALVTDLIYRIIAAVRPVAPTLPLTCSLNGITSSAGWTAATIASYAYLFDFLDQHVYYPTATPVGASDSQAMYTNAWTSGKKIFVGEFGDTFNNSPRTAQVSSVWNNVVTASYSGQPGCFGAAWWAEVEYISTASSDWGMWADSVPLSSNARSDVEPQYAALSAPTYNFGSNMRRRRR